MAYRLQPTSVQHTRKRVNCGYTVKAGEAIVRIKSGSAALVSYERHILTVQNLYEPYLSTVSVRHGNHSMLLCAGQELIVGKNDGSVMKTLKSTSVARRQIRSKELGEINAALSEISLISLINGSALLKSLFHSKEEADKVLTERMLKMFACLSVTTAKHGSYRQMQE